jgi:hypothetical protein
MLGKGRLLQFHENRENICYFFLVTDTINFKGWSCLFYWHHHNAICLVSWCPKRMESISNVSFMFVTYPSVVAVDSEERFTSNILHRHDDWTHRQVSMNWTAVFLNEIQTHENGRKIVDVRIYIMAKVYGSHKRTMGSMETSRTLT